MPGRRSPLALLLAAVLVAGCGTSPTSPSPAPRATPTRVAIAPLSTGTTRPCRPAARAAALLAQMTIEEKIGQMTQLEQGSVDPEGVDDPAPRLGAQRRRRIPGAERRGRLVPDGQGLPGRGARHAARHPDAVRRRRRPRPQQRHRRHDLPAAGGARRVGRRRPGEADRRGDRGRDGRDRHPLGLRSGRGGPAGRPLGPRLRGLRRGPAGGRQARRGVHHRPPGRGPDPHHLGGGHRQALTSAMAGRRGAPPRRPATRSTRA